MAVVARGSKWQVNRTVRGVRAPRLTFDTKQEAEAWEAEVVAAIMAGREIPVPEGRRAKTEKTYAEGTLGQVAKECFDRHWKGTRSAKTQSLYIGLLKDYFGADTPVASITKPMIEDWMHHCRKQGNAGSTVNRKLSTLSKILSYAEGRYITSRPRVQRYPESLPSIRWLEPEEEENLVRLFRQWGLDDHADALIVFVDTGLRMSELWRLTGRHVDLKQGRMRVTNTKTNLDRVVPLTSRVRAILSRRMDTHGRGRLFPGMTNANYRRAWERAKLVLGVDKDERFTPYITRHTCASRLVQRGVDLMIVKTWLGHSSIQTTMRYASLAPGHLNAGVEALERSPGSSYTTDVPLAAE